MHQRTIIRHTIIGLLQAAATPAASRVYGNRFLPWAEQELPAISVYDLDEDVDSDSENTAPRRLTRNTPFMIQVGVEVDELANPPIDDVLDSFLEQIEYAIEVDDRLGGNCALALYGGCQTEVREMGRKQMAFRLITFNIRYNTWSPEVPNPAVVDLETIDVKYNLDGTQTDPRDQTEDTVSL